MSKIAVVYWSGTGNTEKMAGFVVEGAKAAGAEVDLFSAYEFSVDKVAEYEGLAFGCPSMGNEQLEDSEFEPMFEEVKTALNNKKVALFGSYGWGGGEWMKIWEESCSTTGCKLVTESVIVNGEPEADTEEACKELGAALAE